MSFRSTSSHKTLVFNEEANTKAGTKADGGTRINRMAQSDYDRLDIWRDGDGSLYRR